MKPGLIAASLLPFSTVFPPSPSGLFGRPRWTRTKVLRPNVLISASAEEGVDSLTAETESAGLKEEEDDIVEVIIPVR